MKTLPVIMTAIAALCLALPASAQFGQKPQPSRSQIALEKAEAHKTAADIAFAAADAGCTAGKMQDCYALGESYRRGDGVMQSYKLAAEHYETACDGDNANGCAGLAYLSTHARGVPKDLPKSRRLFEKSCELGLASGCAGYGNMLYTGTGGRKDVDRGTVHLRSACDGNYTWACERLEALGARDPGNSAYDRLKDARERF